MRGVSNAGGLVPSLRPDLTLAVDDVRALLGGEELGRVREVDEDCRWRFRTAPLPARRERDSLKNEIAPTTTVKMPSIICVILRQHRTRK